MAKKRPHIPTVKDDGTRWQIINQLTKYPVYQGEGLTRPEAERLAKTMLVRVELKKINTEGGSHDTR